MKLQIAAVFQTTLNCFTYTSLL